MMNTKKLSISVLLSLLAASNGAQAQQQLHVYLQKKLDHPFLSLVALTQEAGQKPHAIAIGVTQRHPAVKATSESLYRIASSTKPFIATTVMKLVIAGKIKLSDKLTKYLGPTYLLGIQNADQVTIKQLLGMRTGIYNYTDNPAFLAFIKQHPKHYWRPMDALNLARNMPRTFAPGQGCKYSNTNYILLGLVIEKASGHSLVHELNKYVFKPLQLNHTFLEMHQPISYPIATSYVNLGDGHYKKITTNDGYGLADGGIVTNVHDMNTFIRNLMFNRKFMPKEYLQKMMQFHPLNSSKKVEYGLGLIRYTFGKLVIIGHDGDDTGRQSWMVVDPKTKKSLALVTNTRPPYLNERAIALATFAGK